MKNNNLGVRIFAGVLAGLMIFGAIAVALAYVL